MLPVDELIAVMAISIRQYNKAEPRSKARVLCFYWSQFFELFIGGEIDVF